ETLDRLIALEPNNNFQLVFRACIDFNERADTRPLHAVIEKILRDDPAAAGAMVGRLFALAMYERDFASADRALAPLTENKHTSFRVRTDAMYFSRAYAEGLLARIKGDAAAARAAFTAARAPASATWLLSNSKPLRKCPSAYPMASSVSIPIGTRCGATRASRKSSFRSRRRRWSPSKGD